LAHEDRFGALLVLVLPPGRRDAPERPVDVAVGRADVVARREVVARAREHDHLDGVVANRAAERLVEPERHARVQRVPPARPVHGADRDRAARIVEDRILLLLAHAALVAASRASVASASPTMRAMRSPTLGSSSRTPTT